MLGYKPHGLEMWDAWCIEREGRAHMLHLQFLSPESARSRLEADSLGHAVSDDLLHWRELAPAFAPGEEGGLDDLQPWTGCLYEHGGTYYLYYTMRSSRDGARTQHIGLATSDDLTRFRRYEGNPVIAPDPRWYVDRECPLPGGVVDCRDLVIVDNPDGTGWYGFYAARVPADDLTEGAAIAVVRSDDLVHWEHLPPAFVPRKYAVVEVPDVFAIDGRWYMTCLTGHGYGNRGIFADRAAFRGTIYAVADSIEGPYRELPDDHLLLAGDYSCGYSCRSFLWQGKRYALYTERGKNTISPPMELAATREGWLRLRYSPLTAGWRQLTVSAPGQLPGIVRLPWCHAIWGLPGGAWEMDAAAAAYRGVAAGRGWQIADLGIGSADVEIEAEVTLESGVAAGLVWRADTEKADASGDLVVMIDADEGVVRAGIAAEFGEPWSRGWRIEHWRACHMRVVVRRPRVEVYIDDMLALQFGGKFADASRPSVGLFVDRAVATIGGLGIYALAAGSDEP
ncbi:glycoside hydrolase family protein [Paenibacillus cymbidii]|uniref:family 43 glycosylhydrolase n=1 Tax=Paenibacillus cymbidii TaxID=1639034 RepID=UPI0014369336|nr:family 43 glycosylhydrolase [Paenibacillus cymbidii]